MRTVTTRIGKSIKTFTNTGREEFLTVEASGGDIALYKNNRCKNKGRNKSVE